MRHEVNRLNRSGVTLVEVLVVAGALVSTGLTGFLLYQQTTQKMGVTSGRLALYSAVAAIERRLVHACMATLFDFQEDLDRRLPVQGLVKNRTAIDGLRTGQHIQVSGGAVTINTLTLKHEKYLGRDISIATLRITASMGTVTASLSQQNERLLSDEIPIFVRIDHLEDPTVMDCAAMTNDQPIGGLAFIGSSQVFANVNNYSELFNYISCLSLTGGIVPCDPGNAAWGVNPNTGEPQTSPPHAPGTPPVSFPVILPGGVRSIAHIPFAGNPGSGGTGSSGSTEGEGEGEGEGEEDGGAPGAPLGANGLDTNN